MYGRLNALTPTTPAASVPEPATLSGLAVVGLALASRSRRNKSKV
ncbi:PEP-CTERM sorting domain-containing protein [Lyngbya sp. CCY1209]|nr:PEP-CTERM sorting domain-containing protein [Lyngbya sp. CCY1209]MEB3884414.1 PEP-CTERM sorting domain-containing protein [Lyngbya sp. CCY1209]